MLIKIIVSLCADAEKILSILIIFSSKFESLRFKITIFAFDGQKLAQKTCCNYPDYDYNYD